MCQYLARIIVVGLVMAVAQVARAENLALVIGNRTHLSQPALPESARLRDARDALENAGFRVLYGTNLTTRAMIDLARQFRDRADKADRLAIVLNGHFVSTGRDSWLLGSDAFDLDGLDVGNQGLSLGALLDIAAKHQGAALLAVGENPVKPKIGPDMTPGVGALDIPQGVTLLHGPVPGLVRFLVRDALVPGRSLGAALASAPRGIVADGFVSRSVPFLPDDMKLMVPVANDTEASDWRRAQSIGSIEALLAYLDRYPAGRYVADANRRIAVLRSDPKRRAQETEDSLHLSRQARRQIQRNLSILGFNPHGVDGIFGRGTRAAISSWQRDNNFGPTGYLTGNEISALQDRADARARKLEEEARRRQDERDRSDAAFWQATGRGATEDDLRAYLRRYPDGLYSEVAQTRLDAIERDKRAQTQADERDLWDRTEANNTADAYRTYLQAYPDGAFAKIAKGRIDALEQDRRNAAARQEEARVAGNPVTRLLIEKRLQALGLNPGRIDGRLDDKARKAIRKFQRSRQIPATGYITQQTIVRLLSAR